MTCPTSRRDEVYPFKAEGDLYYAKTRHMSGNYTIIFFCYEAAEDRAVCEGLHVIRIRGIESGIDETLLLNVRANLGKDQTTYPLVATLPLEARTPRGSKVYIHVEQELDIRTWFNGVPGPLYSYLQKGMKMLAFFRKGVVFTIPTDAQENELPDGTLDEVLRAYDEAHGLTDDNGFGGRIDEGDLIRFAVPAEAVAVESWDEVTAYLTETGAV